MNIHVKTSIILLITFLLGTLVGFLGSNYLHRPGPMPPDDDRMPPFERLRKVEGFQYFMEDLLKPTDEQREQFREILEKHHERLGEIRSQQRKALIKTIDSLHVDLEKILTPEQIEILNKRRKSMPIPEDGPMGPRPFMGKDKRTPFGEPDSARAERQKRRRPEF